MKKFILICISFFALNMICIAQQKSDAAATQVSQLLQSQSYQFRATFIQPTGGTQRNITGTYTLNVSKTEVIADLPYAGRVYNAQIGSTDGGIKFQSKEFNYTMEAGKKGRQEINIKPKDTQERLEIFLTVFENGSASLRVNSSNRQSISYSGDILPLPQPK